MKDSIQNKLDALRDRFDELEALLSDAEIISNQDRFRELSKEYAELEPVVKSYRRFQDTRDGLLEARDLLKDELVWRPFQTASPMSPPSMRWLACPAALRWSFHRLAFAPT